MSAATRSEIHQHNAVHINRPVPLSHITDKKENAMSDNASTIPAFNPSGSDVVAGVKSRTEELMGYIRENVPANRERSIAITNYEQAAMWAVKANFT